MNVLFVEDEEMIRESLAVYFKRNGFEVFQAGDGIEALEVISEQKIDVIVTDTQMPRLNGIDLIKKLRDQNDSTPIYVISGYGDLNRDDFFAAGAQGFLEKPLNRKWLIQILKESTQETG